MVYRVYVEKRPGLTAEADALASDIRTLLGIASLERLRLLNRYDVENITPELFDYSVKTILSEPQLDLVTDTLGERVIVIGAGNAAMDVARTAIRKGVRRLTCFSIICCRRCPGNRR